MEETVTPFQDWTTVTYGNISNRTPTAFNTGDNLCGPKSYQLYKSYPNNDRFRAVLHDVNTQPWITMTASAPNQVLRVHTTDPVYYTNSLFHFYLKVRLNDYEILNPVNAVRWEPIPINLKNCQIGDFNFAAISTVKYNVYTPVIWIQMVRFTEASVTYP